MRHAWKLRHLVELYHGHFGKRKAPEIRADCVTTLE
jgi:hypothetical protein